LEGCIHQSGTCQGGERERERKEKVERERTDQLEEKGEQYQQNYKCDIKG